MADWDSMNLKVAILRGIHLCGFEKPSPIQEKAIPAILTGKDVIAQAQSGTGKTGAFCISVLQRCTEAEEQQALILAPTRELAEQIHSVFVKLSKFTKIRPHLLIGGTSVEHDIHEMKRNPQVIIGCPGRVIDFLTRGYLSTTIHMIVLDEADEMLSQGFIPQLKHIFETVNDKAQAVMFSATIPEEISTIFNKIMRDPIKLLVQSEMLTLEGISQFYISFDNDNDKMEALQDLFEGISVAQTIIYCNSVKRVITLYNSMKEAGYPVCCIHSEMDKMERKESYTDFKNGKYRVLISSNITSRGIDIQQVSIVINFDIPKCVHNYLHRIGRSGRWGRKGIGINFMTKYDKDMMKQIETHYNTEIRELPKNYTDMI
jgi:translation initiation factor 4A